MAVTMDRVPNRLWQGLSTDTKPTDARVIVNDVLYQTDTQTWFIYTPTGWASANSAPVMRTY